MVNNALIPPQFGPDMNTIKAEFDTIARQEAMGRETKKTSATI
jgi:hypothetical protein